MTALAELAGSATSAPVFLAMMARIAFNRAAFASAGAGGLAEDIVHDIDDCRLHIAMVEFAAHIAAFATQVILVADLMLFCSAVVFIPDILWRQREVGVDALSVFIDSDKLM